MLSVTDSRIGRYFPVSRELAWTTQQSLLFTSERKVVYGYVDVQGDSDFASCKTR